MVKRYDFHGGVPTRVGARSLQQGRRADRGRDDEQGAPLGDPQTGRDLWRDRSAIEFADRLSAKLLMVHGVNDPRCPVSQSRIFRDRLLELGRREGEDFEYVELTDEGHGSADIGQKVRTFTILADYLDRVL